MAPVGSLEYPSELYPGGTNESLNIGQSCSGLLANFSFNNWDAQQAVLISRKSSSQESNLN